MSLEPRTDAEIEEELRAGVYYRTGINRFFPGDSVSRSLRATGKAIARLEARQQTLYRSFGLDGSGRDLDDRISQLRGMVPRLGHRPASAPAVSLTRQDTVGAQTYGPGDLMFGRADGRCSYRNTTSITFADGQSTYPVSGDAAPIIATLYGTVGNADIGQIDQVLVGENIQSVTNVQPLVNGEDRESDGSLRVRASLYLQSLARSQPAALEYLARTFVAEDGSRASFVKLVEDPAMASAVLYVDDGNGFASQIRTGKKVSGTVVEGQDVFWFDSPSVFDEVYLDINGVRHYDVWWTTIAERGIAYVLPDKISDLWSAGDEWESQPLQVHSGFVAELTAEIEGSASSPGLLPGWRSSGTRVRVAVPERQWIKIRCQVVAETGYDLEDIESATLNGILEYVTTVDMGDPLLVSGMTAYLKGISGVKDVVFHNPVDPSLPIYRYYAVNRYTRFATDTSRITINGRTSA